MQLMLPYQAIFKAFSLLSKMKILFVIYELYVFVILNELVQS